VTLREIKALLDLVRAYGLTELEVEREGSRLKVRRGAEPAGPAGPAAPAGASAAVAVTTPAAAPESPVPGARPGVLAIEAPMVGTFYRAPAPEAAPFVREGDVVKKGQVVCIIEAMKLMNEIESKVSGRVAKVLVENAQPVEFGQPLFLVDV
jgi:acetyl-CoA carboxylase biotin carboxyl carrier protein